MSKLEAIRDYATRFRDALVSLAPKGLPIGLSTFPTGACGDTCLLLGRGLNEADLGSFRYRCGKLPDRTSTHAWLEKEGMIVDITADQFSPELPPVIVSMGSAWHESIEDVEDHGIAHFARWNGPSMFQLEVAYAEVMTRMNAR